MTDVKVAIAVTPKALKEIIIEHFSISSFSQDVVLKIYFTNLLGLEVELSSIILATEKPINAILEDLPK